jgi:hypothetical protein
MVCCGHELSGLAALIECLQQLRSQAGDASPVTDESFVSVDASRGCTRWCLKPARSAALGLRTGIGIWTVQWDRNTPRLSRCWLEQNVPIHLGAAEGA